MQSMIITPNPSDPEVQILKNEFKKKNYDVEFFIPSTVKVLVECKSHKWTKSDKVPSAKLTVWNEAMYYFLVAPPNFRKIFFVLRDYSEKRNETLATYYLRTYGHLVPDDVEIWEYEPTSLKAEQIN